MGMMRRVGNGEEDEDEEDEDGEDHEDGDDDDEYTTSSVEEVRQHIVR